MPDAEPPGWRWVFDRLASCICIRKGSADEVAYAAVITSCSEHWRRSLWLVHCMSRARDTISQNAFNAACRSISSYGNAQKDRHTHTYIHTYIHTNRHTHIHTYTYIHTHIHTYTHTHTHTHIHTYTHTHIHTYTHTHIHTHIHTYTDTQIHRHTDTHIHRYTDTHTHIYIYILYNNIYIYMY